MKRIILIGSGRSAEYARHIQRQSNDILIALNNAWQTRDDFDYILFASDFPPEKLPTRSSGKLVDTMQIEAAVAKRYGPLMFRGSTMAFNGIYFSLLQSPAAIFTIGCDMDYRVVDGRTHFYGSGGTDPLRYNISLRSLKAKSRRALCFAARQGVVLVRVYDDPAGELSLPRIDVNTYENDFTPPKFDLCKTLADEALEAENSAPFNAAIRKYWKYNSNEKARQYVDKIDRLWQQAVTF